MKYYYICEKCLEKELGKDYLDSEYKIYCIKNAVEVHHNISDSPDITCEKCGSDKMQRVYGNFISYTRGYGYLDKKGAAVDRDRYLMTTGQDPYKGSRSGETLYSKSY